MQNFSRLTYKIAYIWGFEKRHLPFSKTYLDFIDPVFLQKKMVCLYHILVPQII